MTLDFYLPSQIVFGVGKSQRFGELVKSRGKKVFICTTEGLVKRGLLEKLLFNLKKEKVNYFIYPNIKNEPTDIEINEASKLIKKTKCDVVAGVGGGSCMDFAKALAILAKHPKEVWDYVDLSTKPPSHIDQDMVLPIITVPTTSGTGSEVTPFSVVKNTKTIQKGTIKNAAIYPSVALIDPNLHKTIPKELTSAIGIDALSHLLENYYNVQKRNVISDFLVEKSLKLLLENLPKAYLNGNDVESRTAVALASLLGGIANSHSGTTVVHALAHPLGARTKLAHSTTIVIFLNSVMRRTFPLEQNRLNKLMEIFEMKKENRQALAAKMLSQRLNNFLLDLNLDYKISEFNLEKDLIDKIVEDSLSYMIRPIKQHIKVFNKKELAEIVEESF